MVTNGTLMDGNMAASLVDTGINSITFSIDGAAKPVYEAARPGAVFENVIRNISNAVKCGRASGRKNLWFSANFVITKHNVQEIPDFVRLARSIGLDSVRFMHRRVYPSRQADVLNGEVLTPLFEEAAEIGKRCGLAVHCPRLSPSRDFGCQYLQSMYVLLDGNVIPCCAMHPVGRNSPAIVFGNVKEMSVIDIWNCEEYREFRRQLLTDNVPHECVGCVFAKGLVDI